MALYLDGKEVLADVYMKGTWRAVGTVTLPAFTLGGAITGGGQTILGCTYIGGQTTDNFTVVGMGTNRILYIEARRTNASTGDAIKVRTYNAADSATDRLTLTGGVNIAIATWQAITHIGLVLSGSLDAAGNYISFTEMSAPGAGSANTARLYTKLVNGGKTGLYVIFQTGAEIQIAVEA